MYQQRIKTMRILMINVVCGIRSTGRICTDIAEYLDKQGHEVKIAYGRFDVPEKYKKYSYKIGNDFDVCLHAGVSLLLDNSGLMSKKVTVKFIEWIKDYNPDVIHLHNIHGYYLNFEILFDYLRGCGKRIIWTLHDCWSFTGHCAYFDYSQCSKWKNGCESCPSLKDYPPCFIKDNSSENYQVKKRVFTSIPNLTIVTPSQWLASLVKESFLSEYQVKVINNSIDYNVFKPTVSDFREKNGLSGKTIILGVASVWDRRKGLSDFIQLSQMLTDDYKIVLVGLNNKQLKEIPDDILGITHTSNIKELAELYTMADVFLNLTYEDNYPTTNLEAQACGTPVISYKTGGSTESALEYGMVVEKAQLDEIIQILKNKEYTKCVDNRKMHHFEKEYACLYNVE